MSLNFSFLKDLQSRNLIHNSTPNVDHYLTENAKSNEIAKVYAGFDPSGQSLQLGNLLPIQLLRRAQLNSVQPMALLGGATGLIGDPSGKKAERTLLDINMAESNLEKIKLQISKWIDFSPGKYQGLMVNNYDWFKNINYIEFLRDVGKHITINYMIAKDSVKLRMETGISYAEFGYMLMQGYDYLHLYENYGCKIQIGGSDQWGNITTGIELIRRKHGAEAHAISSPLLTDSAGNKLGKTEDGAIYLDPNLTSPYQFYQYLLNIADSDVILLLKSLTLISIEDIQNAELSLAKNPDQRFSQKLLAQNLTDLIHGQECTLAAEQSSQVLFSKDPEILNHLKPGTLETLAREIPSTTLDSVAHLNVLDTLVTTKLVDSKGEGRRNIQGGAITINRQKVSDEKQLLNQDLFNALGFLLIALGKNKLHLIMRRK
jgi:tyrosyl-tRNA synthetase